MQIDHQRGTPAIAHCVQRFGCCSMIGLVDAFETREQIGFGKGPAPQLAQTRQTPRHESQPAACPPPSSKAHSPIGSAALHHFPVDIVRRTIEVDHGPWGVSYEQSRPRFLRHPHGHQVYKTVFEA